MGTEYFLNLLFRYVHTFSNYSFHFSIYYYNITACQSSIQDILKSESINTDNSQPPRSQAAVVEAIKRCLPTTDLKKAKMVCIMCTKSLFLSTFQPSTLHCSNLFFLLDTHLADIPSSLTSSSLVCILYQSWPSSCRCSRLNEL